MTRARRIVMAMALGITGLVLASCGPPPVPTVRLFEAARDGNLSQIRSHIFHGSNLNRPGPNRMHAMAYAMVYDHPEIYFELAKAGASVKGLDDRGWNLLHYAAATGQDAICQDLLDRGLPIDQRTSQDDASPYQLAMVYGHAKTAELLRRKGADTTLRKLKNLPRRAAA